MYTDPIPAIQIASSSIVKKARPPPRDRVTTSTSESMTFEHNYASSSTCDVEVSVADDMDISCDDGGETPIQTPRSVDAQRSSYSSYKSHNTF